MRDGLHTAVVPTYLGHCLDGRYNYVPTLYIPRLDRLANLD